MPEVVWVSVGPDSGVNDLTATYRIPRVGRSRPCPNAIRLTFSVQNPSHRQQTSLRQDTQKKTKRTGVIERDSARNWMTQQWELPIPKRYP